MNPAESFDLEEQADPAAFAGRLRSEEDGRIAQHGSVELAIMIKSGADDPPEGTESSEVRDGESLTCSRLRRTSSAARKLHGVIRELADAKANADAVGNKRLLYIRKVPRYIRDSSPGDFEPKLVHLGALRRQSGGDSDAVRQVKFSCLLSLLRRSNLPVEKQLDEYLEAVASIEERARSQYYGPDSEQLHSEDFVVKMVVDGCFILEFLNNNFFLHDDARPRRRLRSSPVSIWDRRVLARDVLLLENQIPFDVLRVLFNKTDYLPRN